MTWDAITRLPETVSPWSHGTTSRPGCGPPLIWIPTPGPRHGEILGALLLGHHLRGNLTPDAELAALALEHGLTVCSADTDFANFESVRWENPLVS